MRATAANEFGSSDQPDGSNPTHATRIFSVMPAKAHPGWASTVSAALGPRLRGGDEEGKWEPSVWFVPLTAGVTYIQRAMANPTPSEAARRNLVGLGRAGLAAEMAAFGAEP